MIWRLIRKAARLYALIAIIVLSLMLASAPITSHQLSSEFMLTAFFPYGVLAGLVTSWFFMRAGAWLTIFSLAGFYTTSVLQYGNWPDSDLALLLAGSAPLFLFAAFLKSIGHSRHKKRQRKKRSRSS